MARINRNRIDLGLSAFLRLIVREPDEELIRTYFLTRVGEVPRRRLSDVEVKWILLNLRYNELWRQRWAQYESDWGALVSHSSRGVAEPAAEYRSGISDGTGVRAVIAGLVICLAAMGVNYPVRSPTSFLGTVAEDLVDSVHRGTGRADPAWREAIRTIELADRVGWRGRADDAQLDRAVARLAAIHRTSSDPFHRSNAAFLAGLASSQLSVPCNASRWFRSSLAEDVADYRLESVSRLRQIVDDCAVSQATVSGRE